MVLRLRGSALRLKRDIVRLLDRTSPSGIPVYSFRYIGDGADGPVHVGTMAQDLLAMGRADAVVTGEDGFYLVDYDALDISLSCPSLL